MKNIVSFGRACPEGLAIIAERMAAWTSHNHARVVEANRREDEHMATCTQCNPDLLVTQLWPKAKVIE